MREELLICYQDWAGHKILLFRNNTIPTREGVWAVVWGGHHGGAGGGGYRRRLRLARRKVGAPHLPHHGQQVGLPVNIFKTRLVCVQE